MPGLHRAGPGDRPGEDAVADTWWVDDVDVDAVRSLGWRYEVGGREDAVGEEVADLSSLLGLAPGVTRVERQDSASWLVAENADRTALEAVLRGWVRSR